MTILASAIITSLRGQLTDPAPGALWLDAELLGRISEAERAIVAVKHEAYPVRGPVALTAGTKQTLPAGGLAVMEAYDNVVSGRRCTLTNRELQDAAATFFPAATPEVDAQHYMKDERDPSRFDVVPPNDGTGSLNMLYGAIPTAIATTGDPINVLDIYEQCIKAFVLSKCYADETIRQDFNKAASYANDWKVILGLSSQSQVTVAPKVGHQGGAS